MKLYTYWRSSSAYRVRIALNLKGLDYDPTAVNLVKDGGQQYTSEYEQINPQHLVPALAVGDYVLTQSLAILEYLEERYPQPPLLPHDLLERARVRAMALLVATDIQPLNNSRVLKYLRTTLMQDEDKVRQWCCGWLKRGFQALETLLQHPETGRFCHGDSPTFADVCLVPQYYNALRFECDLSPYPTITRINEACLALEAFQSAVPEAQPDAQV